jgi:excisionase family DNA binding protein
MTKKITGTVDEAAEVLGVSRNTAYDAVKTGEIPSKRMNKRIIVLWRPFMRMLGVGDEEAV